MKLLTLFIGVCFCFASYAQPIEDVKKSFGTLNVGALTQDLQKVNKYLPTPISGGTGEIINRPRGERNRAITFLKELKFRRASESKSSGATELATSALLSFGGRYEGNPRYSDADRKFANKLIADLAETYKNPPEGNSEFGIELRNLLKSILTKSEFETLLEERRKLQGNRSHKPTQSPHPPSRSNHGHNY